MKLVMFTIIIVSGINLHKTAVNTKSGTETCIKGKDELPNWIVAAASHYEPEVGSV